MACTARFSPEIMRRLLEPEPPPRSATMQRRKTPTPGERVNAIMSRSDAQRLQDAINESDRGRRLAVGQLDTVNAKVQQLESALEHADTINGEVIAERDALQQRNEYLERRLSEVEARAAATLRRERAALAEAASHRKQLLRHVELTANPLIHIPVDRVPVDRVQGGFPPQFRDVRVDDLKREITVLKSAVRALNVCDSDRVDDVNELDARVKALEERSR